MPGEAFGATPLLGAVHRDNRRMVDVLLDAGADINARSQWWAGSFGVLDHDGTLAEHLIARGARIDVHAAARLGKLERLEELLSVNSALVHARGGDGQTPLHFARSVEVARYLLDHGAEIDARDVDHESTPAQWMVRDRQEVARYLVDRGCHTDLLLAAALGDADRVSAHLAADPALVRITVSERYFPKRDPRSGGAIYNWTLGTGKSAHAIAHEFGHTGVFTTLMAHSPDDLALAVACEIGDEAAVTGLLTANPRLADTLGDEDVRKLADAARDDNLSAVRLMLRAGWPVDARGQHGGTPLHWAGWNGNSEMASELLRFTPPLEILDRDYGGTPLFWTVYGSVHGWRCRTGDYAGTVRLLLDAGARAPGLTADLEASAAVREVLAEYSRQRS
jgi:ankyrin repeat protein